MKCKRAGRILKIVELLKVEEEECIYCIRGKDVLYVLKDSA